MADEVSSPEGEGRVVATASVQGWSGPLPPPATLRAFEEAAPGTAQLIVQEFQREADHRRRLEERPARFVVRETHAGQALALLFVVLMVGLIGFAIHEKAPWIAGVLGTGVITAGVVAFLRGRASD